MGSWAHPLGDDSPAKECRAPTKKGLKKPNKSLPGKPQAVILHLQCIAGGLPLPPFHHGPHGRARDCALVIWRAHLPASPQGQHWGARPRAFRDPLSCPTAIGLRWRLSTDHPGEWIMGQIPTDALSYPTAASCGCPNELPQAEWLKNPMNWARTVVHTAK